MQRKTTASNSLPDDWEALGRLMALRLAYYVKVYGIPKELVVGLDETPVKTTPNAELATRALRNSGDVARRDEDEGGLPCGNRTRRVDGVGHLTFNFHRRSGKRRARRGPGTPSSRTRPFCSTCGAGSSSGPARRTRPSDRN